MTVKFIGCTKDKQLVSLWTDTRKSFLYRCCGKRMTLQVKLHYHQCGVHVARKETRLHCECCQETQSLDPRHDFHM
jgi:hypothetical protein